MQVPNFVAKRWRADCQRAAKSMDGAPVELGRVRITKIATEVRMHSLLSSPLAAITGAAAKDAFPRCTVQRHLPAAGALCGGRAAAELQPARANREHHAHAGLCGPGRPPECTLCCMSPATHACTGCAQLYVPAPPAKLTELISAAACCRHGGAREEEVRPGHEAGPGGEAAPAHDAYPRGNVQCCCNIPMLQ